MPQRSKSSIEYYQIKLKRKKKKNRKKNRIEESLTHLLDMDRYWDREKIRNPKARDRIDLIWRELKREEKERGERKRERERVPVRRLRAFWRYVYYCVRVCEFFWVIGFFEVKLRKWPLVWKRDKSLCLCVLLVKSRGSSGIVVKFFFFLNEFDRIWTFASTLWLVVYC